MPSFWTSNELMRETKNHLLKADELQFTWFVITFIGKVNTAGNKANWFLWTYPISRTRRKERNHKAIDDENALPQWRDQRGLATAFDLAAFRLSHDRPQLRNLSIIRELAWVSGVSGEKGKDGSEKGREVKKRLTQMLLLEPSTPTQHDSIPSNQNHFRSLGCQLHVSKSSPKINLTLRSGRAPVLVLLRFRFFLKPPMRSFRILVL